MKSGPAVLLRGGGDLATGVGARLHRSGFNIVVLEVAKPLAVRRLVAFAEAVYRGWTEVEGLEARLVEGVEGIGELYEAGKIPVLVDPEAKIQRQMDFSAIVDARMRKKPSGGSAASSPFLVGLGPGFEAGRDCHAVVETNRGHHMGRVIWEGSAEPDTGVPEPVQGYSVDRVLRAPVSGELRDGLELGMVVGEGQVIARIGEDPLRAPFSGALRGLLHDGLWVETGMKVGDLDPRAEPSYCFQISDKALAVGGGVLEALLSQAEIRRQFGA